MIHGARENLIFLKTLSLVKLKAIHIQHSLTFPYIETWGCNQSKTVHKQTSVQECFQKEEIVIKERDKNQILYFERTF